MSEITLKNRGSLADLESFALSVGNGVFEDRANELRALANGSDQPKPDQHLAAKLEGLFVGIFGDNKDAWPAVVRDSLESIKLGIGLTSFNNSLISALQNLRTDEIGSMAFDAAVGVVAQLIGQNGPMNRATIELVEQVLQLQTTAQNSFIPESAARAGLSFISSPLSLAAPLIAGGIAGRAVTSFAANTGKILSLTDEAIVGIATLFGLIGESTAFVASSDAIQYVAEGFSPPSKPWNAKTFRYEESFLQETFASTLLFGGLKAIGRFGVLVRTFLPETEAGLALAKLAAHATSVAGLAVMEPVQDLAGIAPMASKNFYEALWRALFLHTTIAATNGVISLEGVKSESLQLSIKAQQFMERLKETLTAPAIIATNGREFRVPTSFATDGPGEPPDISKQATEAKPPEPSDPDPDMLVLKVGKRFKLPKDVPNEPTPGLVEYKVDPDKAAEALANKTTIGTDESRIAEEDTAVTGRSSIPTETELLAELERLAPGTAIMTIDPESVRAQKEVFLWLVVLYRGSNDPAHILEAIKILDGHNANFFVHDAKDINAITEVALATQEPETIKVFARIFARSYKSDYALSPETRLALAKASLEPKIVASAVFESATETAREFVEYIRQKYPKLIGKIEAEFSEKFNIFSGLFEQRIRPITFLALDGSAEAKVGGFLEKVDGIVQKARTLGLSIPEIAAGKFDALLEKAASMGVVLEDGKAILVKKVAPFYQAYAKRDLGLLKDVLDYVARKHRYGTLPLEEMTDEITQELPAEEPPEFYNIYNGAETILLSKDMPKFRSGDLIGRIEPPHAKWGIERNEHQYWTFYYARDFYTPSAEGRFYITIDPSLYKGLIGEMASELQTRMKGGDAAKKFYFKLTNEVQKDGTAVRRDHLVVYFKNADGPAVRAAVEGAVQKIEAKHPNAFSEKGPYFTMKVRRGLFFGEEPSAERQSFGGLRSTAINNAMAEIKWMLKEGFTITPEERAYIVAAVFEAKGIDPEFPAFNVGGREKFTYLFEPSDIQGPVAPPARAHDDLTAPTTTGFTPEGREHVVNFDFANSWPSGTEEIIIGRGRPANISATQRYISREHAKIVKNSDGTYTLFDICKKQLISIQTLDEDGVNFVELDFIGPGSENIGQSRDYKVLKPGKKYRIVIGEVVVELEIPQN